MRWFARILCAVLLVALSLTMLFPANIESGPADPILDLRMRTLRFLMKHGIIDEPGFFGTYPWLPTRGGSEWRHGNVVTARVTTTSEPVYRGLFWLVGHRITVRLEEIIPPRSDYEQWSLGYVVGDRVVIAATKTYEAGTTDFVISGFVPAGSAGHFVHGNEHSQPASLMFEWGTTDMDAPLKAQGWD